MTAALVGLAAFAAGFLLNRHLARHLARDVYVAGCAAGANAAVRGLDARGMILRPGGAPKRETMN